MTEKEIVRAALKEDRASRDLSAMMVPAKKGRAVILAKSDGILAGIDLAGEVFRQLDKNIAFIILKKDGSRVKKGVIVARLEGNARTIISGERTALNFLQHLSGIATFTNLFVKSAGKIKIYDTRKTIPGMREWEKYAVKLGGGFNHRLNLEDGVMIKDNHWRLWDGNLNTVHELLKDSWKRTDIVVEVDDLNKLETAFKFSPKVIMLDNMDTKGIKQAVSCIREKNKKIEIEVSGGVTLERLNKLVKLGIDRVSVGAITQSAPSLDLSLEIIE